MVASAITQTLRDVEWGALDVLVVDMPPGIHDTTLELARVAPSARHLVVTTGSRLAIAVAARLLHHLRDSGTTVTGIVENMARAGVTDAGAAVASLAAGARVPVLGTLPFDPDLDAAIGDPGRLVGTDFARSLEPIFDRASNHETNLSTE